MYLCKSLWMLHIRLYKKDLTIQEKIKIILGMVFPKKLIINGDLKQMREGIKMTYDKLYTYGYNTNEEYYNKYRSDSIWYGFSEESCNETIQEEISQTKDKLKM